MIAVLKVNTFGFRADGEGKDKGDVKNECEGKIPGFSSDRHDVRLGIYENLSAQNYDHHSHATARASTRSSWSRLMNGRAKNGGKGK